ECRERRNRGAQHVHRMRRLYRFYYCEYFFRQFSCVLKFQSKSIKLGLLRKLALQQEVAALFKRRVLREVVDRVAAVAQLARAPVDAAHARAVEVDVLQAAPDLDLGRFFRHGTSCYCVTGAPPSKGSPGK